MPKTERCPDCGAKLNDPNHPALTPAPAEWSVSEFVRVLDQPWRFDPAEVRVCCGVPTLAAFMRPSAIPQKHAQHVVAPRLLWDLYTHGLRKKVLRELVFWVYAHCMVPLLRLSAEQWTEMFRAAGYTEYDDKHRDSSRPYSTDRPSEVPVLYRAATAEGASGLSWTSSRSHAELFGTHRRWFVGNAPHKIYRLTDVPPSAVLGLQRFEIGETGTRDGVSGTRWAPRAYSDEWVVDTTGLNVEEVPERPCDCAAHWGDLGAAGLLVGLRRKRRATHVLLQLRFDHSEEGNAWSIPGGALEPGEDDQTAALRETVEETALDVSALDIVGKYRDDSHGADWHYTTVLAVADRKLDVNTDSPETEDLRWVRLDDVDSLNLHPGLAKTWPELRALLEQAQ